MNIIVTGASRGIGYQTVKVLAQNPSNKVLALSRNYEKLKELKEESSHGNISIAVLDLERRDIKVQINKLGIDNAFNSIDVLINNAGSLVNKPFSELEREDLERTFQVNFFGVIELIQLLKPKMKKGTHIVNIGSMGGFQGASKFKGLSVYSSSKGAIAILSECLAEEFSEDGIKVNCLALGAAQTEMLSEAFPGYEAPLSAEEMGTFIADFSLKSHSYLNGKVIPVSLSTP